jgi:hypothetical protein
VFQGDSIELIHLPSLNDPSKPEEYAMDSEGDIFRIVAFDHCNEPHSLYYNSTLLDDSNAYFVVPMHWFFVLIALYYRESSECDLAINMQNVLVTNRLSRDLDMNAIFERGGGEGEFKMNWEKCCIFFDSVFDAIPQDIHSTYDNFIIRWASKDLKKSCSMKTAFGMETLRDLVPESILLRYADRSGIVPISDEAALSGPTGIDTPKPSNKRTKKSLENVTGNMRISAFFKPLENN